MTGTPPAPAAPVHSATNDLVIEARGLTKVYRLRRRRFSRQVALRAVDGVTFQLERGRTLAVVGESGCGKSTLARLLTLIEAPTSGRLTLVGAETAGAGTEAIKALRRNVKIVFQDPYGSLNPRSKVGSILEEPLIINTNLNKAERSRAAREMMARVGLRPEHYDRYPHMFSGGQRQRVAIARALMLHPRIVIADEPLSALDVSIQAQVLNLLMDLQEELKLAYVFISHNLSVVRHIADDVAVMYLGRIVEHGPKQQIFEKPCHPYTKALLASTPFVDPRLRSERVTVIGEPPSPLQPPLGCAFHTRCPFTKALCVSERPELRPLAGRLVACHYAEALA
jgi:dipeptide transport system ATP-binding protein